MRGFNSGKFRPVKGPGRMQHGTPPPAKKCYLCGEVFTDVQHLVDAHGYIRQGAQVFKRYFCHCGKPGIYRVGTQNFCSTHKQDAVKGAKIVTKNWDKHTIEADKIEDEKDKLLKGVEAHKQATGKRRKPVGSA